MSKAGKFFKAIGLIFKQPSLLNHVLDDANVNKTEVVKKYNLPQGLKTVQLSDLIPNFNQTVEPYCSMDGGSTPFDLALLKGLAAQKKECAYFEIGTWRGESVANVASVAKECVTLNLSDESLLEMGLDKNYVNLHRFYSKNLNNVKHIYGNSQTFDFASLGKKFDLIFIDGDHHSESVMNDTKNAFELLKDENSIIVWHDYGNTPADIRWDVLKGILDGCPKGQENYIYRVSNTLCAIYTKQAISSSFSVLHSDPKVHFSVNVKVSQ